MEGFAIFIFLVSAFVGLLMLLAQLKLFAIARTLENILGELRKQNQSQAAPTSEAETQPVLTSSSAAAASTPRTLMERLGGKL